MERSARINSNIFLYHTKQQKKKLTLITFLTWLEIGNLKFDIMVVNATILQYKWLKIPRQLKLLNRRWSTTN